MRAYGQGKPHLAETLLSTKTTYEIRDPQVASTYLPDFISSGLGVIRGHVHGGSVQGKDVCLSLLQYPPIYDPPIYDKVQSIH